MRTKFLLSVNEFSTWTLLLYYFFQISKLMNWGKRNKRFLLLKKKSEYWLMWRWLAHLFWRGYYIIWLCISILEVKNFVLGGKIEIVVLFISERRDRIEMPF